MIRRGQAAFKAPARFPRGGNRDGVCCRCVLLPFPFFALASPGPGREVRSWIGWTRPGKAARLGVRFFRGALQGERSFLLSPQLETGLPHSLVGSPTFFVFLLVLVWGKTRLSGHQLEGVAARCSLDCGGLSHT